MLTIDCMMCLAEIKVVMLPTLFADRHHLSAMFVSASSVVLIAVADECGLLLRILLFHDLRLKLYA
jgi:hypothetical protein